MKFPHSRLVTAMAASALIAVPASNPKLTRTIGARGLPDPQSIYSTHDKEFYLTKDEFSYVRPGLNITVNSITNVAPGQKPVVDVTMTDSLGQPVDRKGVITPGIVIVYFIIARYNPATRDYTNYTTAGGEPLHDIGGDWQDLAVGHSIYTFGGRMPASLDISQTTTLGIYATRYTRQVVGKDYEAPAVIQYFRPDGGAPSGDTFDAIATAACNTCHNPLSKHADFGPAIQDVKLCVMCHTPDFPTTATGESLNFKVFIHKLHDGAELPSVQAGTPYVLTPGNDFSTVVFPQDIRNCTSCHGSTDPSQPNYTTQAFSWYTYPSMAACASCHDLTTFNVGGTHTGGPQVDDSGCANCHQPTSGGEWNASVIDAHTVPTKSAQLKGVNAVITSVTHTAPGQNPTVVFSIKQNDGTPIPPSAFTTQNSDGTTSSGLNVIMSGPTTDYALPPQIRERADGATASGANYSYTFTTPVPADATGTWGFSIEARLTVTLNPAPKDTTTARDAAFNPVYYAAVTDSVPVPRRVVVDIAQCNTCHDQLSFHGSNRLNPQECVFCHNPNMHDDQSPPESLDFKRMIHKIHRGEDLTQTYLDFNHVRFPGDLRDCQKCHTTTDAAPDGTEQVFENPPPGLLATQTPRDWYTPMQHFATACLACHDSQSAAAHAFTMTAPFGEACAACHGPDADFSVDKVHAH